MQYSHRNSPREERARENSYKKTREYIIRLPRNAKPKIVMMHDGKKNMRSLAGSFIHAFGRSSKSTSTSAQGENGIHWNFYHARHTHKEPRRQRLKTDLAVKPNAIVLSAFNGFTLRFQSGQSSCSNSNNAMPIKRSRNGPKCTVFSTCHCCVELK